MEVQTNNQERWIKGKFDHFVSSSNREKLTDYVVARLVQVNAGKIFDAGLPEKVIRGVTNVLVDTAYAESFEAPAKEGSFDKLLAKRKFYTNDPEIIEICQNAGMFYGKPVAKLINDVIEKFDFDIERAKEVIKYVGMRRGNDGAYDIYSIFRIATDSSKLLKVYTNPLSRKQVMDRVLRETAEFEATIKEMERGSNREYMELRSIDPEYINNTPTN